MSREETQLERSRKPYLWLCGVVSLLTAALMVYAQTWSFTWDEPYHLLAAQLVKGGKRLYLDFLYPQTPLNTYWNALLMRIFGDGWRVTHVSATLFTGGAILLVADFVFSRLPVPRWRLAAAIATAVSIGVNTQVMEYATLGQAYGICLFSTAAAFRLSILAAAGEGLLPAGLAGLFAGIAASSSLLTAAAAPTLAVWIVVYDRAGRRWAKLAACVAGVAVASSPLLWLFVQSPRQVLFSVVEYQLLHRAARWPHAGVQNLGVLTAWINSSHALILALLGAAGLAFIFYRSNWDRRSKAEFYLCAWLALALGIHISTAWPTFSRYYLLIVPYVSVLAAVGLYWVASQLYGAGRTALPASLLVALMVLGEAKYLAAGQDFTWRDCADVARKIEAVTPPGGVIMGDEYTYFLTRRTPPSGMELEDSHKLEVPPEFARKMHIVTGTELHRRLESGVFSSVQTCEDDEGKEEYGFAKLYRHFATFGACTVYWDFRRP